jgi:Frag1/DRAM/Sfk1 family
VQFREDEAVGSSKRVDIRATGVEGNARLTSSAAVILLILLAAEGLTLPAIHALLRPHVYIGFALIPPVALKLGSTLYRFTRYYMRAPRYRQKGPPPALLRTLGPVVVLSTVLLLASGVALLFFTGSWQQGMLTVHKASFVLWFAAMTVHVVAHIVETAQLGARDWLPQQAHSLPMAAVRRWLLAATVLAGALLGAWGLGHIGGWHRA